MGDISTLSFALMLVLTVRRWNHWTEEEITGWTIVEAFLLGTLTTLAFCLVVT